MGMSQDAYVAWGFDLGGSDEGWNCNEDRYDDLWKALDGICGFTEEAPFGGTREEFDAYAARRDTAVLVDTHFYGHCDYGGHLLVLKRESHAYWGVEEFDPKAIEPPTAAELECFSKVLDYLEYEGDRTPKLLIWASYG